MVHIIAGGTEALRVATLSAYLFAIRLWHLRWGASDEEVQRCMTDTETVRRRVLLLYDPGSLFFSGLYMNTSKGEHDAWQDR